MPRATIGRFSEQMLLKGANTMKNHTVCVSCLVLALLMVGPAAAAPKDEGSAPAEDAARQATLQQRIDAVEDELDQAPDDPALRTRLAKLLHLKGVAGDAAATRRSRKLLRALLEADPDDATLRAYLGSNDLIRASRTWAVWKKGEITKAGLKRLDAAAAAEQDNVEVRFIRGMSLLGLPDWMEQRAKAETDLAWVADRAEQAVAKDELAPFMAASALLNHGRVRQEAGDSDDAEAAWRQAVRLAPDSEAGQEAQALLDGTDAGETG